MSAPNGFTQFIQSDSEEKSLIGVAVAVDKESAAYMGGTIGIGIAIGIIIGVWVSLIVVNRVLTD